MTATASKPNVFTDKIGFEVDSSKVYYVCVQNGDAAGAQRATKLAAMVDGKTIISWTSFSPTDAPLWVASGPLSLTPSGTPPKSSLTGGIMLPSGATAMSATFTIRSGPK
jgi:hypothetical protein